MIFHKVINFKFLLRNALYLIFVLKKFSKENLFYDK